MQTRAQQQGVGDVILRFVNAGEWLALVRGGMMPSLLERLEPLETFQGLMRNAALSDAAWGLSEIALRACKRWAAQPDAGALKALRALRAACVMPRLVDALLRISIFVQGEFQDSFSAVVSCAMLLMAGGRSQLRAAPHLQRRFSVLLSTTRQRFLRAPASFVVSLIDNMLAGVVEWSSDSEPMREMLDLTLRLSKAKCNTEETVCVQRVAGGSGVHKLR